jgi:carboxyl-terminal processing protease
MPDYFVPLDTTLNSHYLNELFISTAIQEYTFKYAEDHKQDLESKGFDQFFSKFEVSDQMLDELVKVGVRNKVKPDYKELNKKKKLFKIHVKSQIARKIWGNEGFYPVYNETNEVFKKALEVFDRIPDLTRNKM